jgi:hypothetical protein
VVDNPPNDERAQGKLDYGEVPVRRAGEGVQRDAPEHLQTLCPPLPDARPRAGVIELATPVMMRKSRQRSARLKTLSLCFGMTQGGHLEEPPILTRRRPSDPHG